jgi:Putative transposase
LPSALRDLARRAPESIYNLLFDAASKTLLELGRDPKRLGGQLGLTAVLHTWTRELELHPHLHCIVTGGALSQEGDRWVAAPGKDRYLFPVKVLSRLFRGKFLAKLARRFKAGELGLDPKNKLQQRAFEAVKEKLYGHEWVVYAKRPFAGAQHVYQYLGRYTHRVGLSNHRLREITDDTVTFATKNGRTITLTHDEFMRRFLLHVLPPRFVKIRHYGLMASSNATTKLEIARRLLEAQGALGVERGHLGAESWQDFYERLTGTDLRKCPRCGGPMLRYDLKELPEDVRLALAAMTDGKGPDP